jgi:hypothetical protein
LYVALVGPVFYFLRKRDYRVVLGGFVATVALFAWVFTVVGGRGYGERQIYHSLALARAIEGNKWDVRHWVHAFATSGDSYLFRAPGASQLYAALGDGESVRGEVIQGREASFRADIPLFSSRPFVHQGIMSGPQLSWEVTDFALTKSRSALRTLRLKTPADFQPAILSVIAQHGTSFYMLNPQGGEWILGNGTSRPMNELFGGSQGWEYGYYSESPAAAMERLRRPPSRLARMIGGDAESSRVALGRPPEGNRVRIFTYADAPAAFPLESSDFQAGLGFVLFVQDLAAPAPAAP